MYLSEKIFLLVLSFVIIACMLVAIIQKFKNDVYDDHQEKIISVVNDGFNYDEVEYEFQLHCLVQVYLDSLQSR